MPADRAVKYSISCSAIESLTRRLYGSEDGLVFADV
jgi:hypothetical protein